MVMDYIIAFYKKNTGAVLGSTVGLLTSVSILTIGLFRTLFIAIFVLMGYYIGTRISDDKDYIKKFLDKILPPGTYR